MAEDMSLPEVFLDRTGVLVASKSSVGESAIGERGLLNVGGVVYYTIERRGHYVMLPEGIFECEMEDQIHSRGKIFRIKNHGEHGHNVLNSRGEYAGILIHSSNYPHHVTGCVAPGISQIQNGVGHSREAMSALFQFCGGFGLGKKMLLHVSAPKIK